MHPGTRPSIEVKVHKMAEIFEQIRSFTDLNRDRNLEQ